MKTIFLTLILSGAALFLAGCAGSSEPALPQNPGVFERVGSAGATTPAVPGTFERVGDY
jgi:hypothetical protein